MRQNGARDLSDLYRRQPPLEELLNAVAGRNTRSDRVVYHSAQRCNFFWPSEVPPQISVRPRERETSAGAYHQKVALTGGSLEIHRPSVKKQITMLSTSSRRKAKTRGQHRN